MQDRLPPPPDHGFEFSGGALCLDFANTIGGTHVRPSHEHLREFADVVHFAREAGAVTSTAARRLTTEAQRRPGEAAAVLRRAVELREAIWRVFSTIAYEGDPAAADVALIGEAAARATTHAQLERDGERYAWRWTDGDALERPLWPIARSAAELLTAPKDLARVRECASETCQWVFVDRSRNHSRRWCDMSDCGNRAKVRRFYERARRARRANVR